MGKILDARSIGTSCPPSVPLINIIKGERGASYSPSTLRFLGAPAAVFTKNGAYSLSIPMAPPSILHRDGRHEGLPFAPDEGQLACESPQGLLRFPVDPHSRPPGSPGSRHARLHSSSPSVFSIPDSPLRHTLRIVRTAEPRLWTPSTDFCFNFPLRDAPAKSKLVSRPPESDSLTTELRFGGGGRRDGLAEPPRRSPPPAPWSHAPPSTAGRVAFPGLFLLCSARLAAGQDRAAVTRLAVRTLRLRTLTERSPAPGFQAHGLTILGNPDAAPAFFGQHGPFLFGSGEWAFGTARATGRRPVCVGGHLL